MPAWDGELYLTFAVERTRPAEELAARVAVEAPARVADLGCGPGNSTAVLARRWPAAALTGIDRSEAMLAFAQTAHPQWTWIAGDISTWRAGEPFDVVFSNAALQWVPDHARQFPRLLTQVAPGGALAVQLPANLDAPAHVLMRDLAASPAWRDWFPEAPRGWHVEPAEQYYDMLAGAASHLDIWTTEYLHVLDDVDAIVDWYRGTGLRPWLEALPDDIRRRRFLSEYRARLAASFMPRPGGRVLLPFRRLFIIAYR